MSPAPDPTGRALAWACSFAAVVVAVRAAHALWPAVADVARRLWP